MLPSKYTSDESLEDAIQCAKNLKISPDEIAINKIVETAEIQLNPFFKDTEKDITEENIQSRIRAVLLMALSNKFNRLLLTTGNKSEMAVGYATLYGDMSGAFNPIKDLYKTEVYKIAEMRNKNKTIGMPWSRGRSNTEKYHYQSANSGAKGKSDGPRLIARL